MSDYLTGPRYAESEGAMNLDADEVVVNVAAAVADLADRLLLRVEDGRSHTSDDVLIDVAARLRAEASTIWDAAGQRLLTPVTTAAGSAAGKAKAAEPPAPAPNPDAEPEPEPAARPPGDRRRWDLSDFDLGQIEWEEDAFEPFVLGHALTKFADNLEDDDCPVGREEMEGVASDLRRSALLLMVVAARRMAGVSHPEGGGRAKP